MKSIVIGKSNIVAENSITVIFRVWVGNFALNVFMNKEDFKRAEYPKGLKLFPRFLDGNNLRQLDDSNPMEFVAWLNAFGIKELSDILIIQSDLFEYGIYKAEKEG